MARLARRRDSYPVRHIFSAIRFVLTFFQGHYGQLHLRAWTESNCQGKVAFTTFNNISFAYLSRSFKLCRPLQGQSSWISPWQANLKLGFQIRINYFISSNKAILLSTGALITITHPTLLAIGYGSILASERRQSSPHVEHTICRVGTWKDKFIFKP